MAVDVVKSAGRVFDILEHFRVLKRPASVGQLAHGLNLPQSSVSVLLKSMVTLGYLDFFPETRVFMPSLRVALLSDWLGAVDPVAQQLSDRLTSLQRATGETVILARRHGPHVQYLSILRADCVDTLPVGNGMLRPMTLPAAGVMLLSTLRPTEARAIIRRNNSDLSDPALRVCEGDMMAYLEKVRRQGHALTQVQPMAGARAIATLAPTEPDAPAVVVAVAGPQERIVARSMAILGAFKEHIGSLTQVSSLSRRA